MILITRDANNTIFLTLTELVTLANPYFIFEFENKQTQEISLCALSNISTDTERYDSFVITEPDDCLLVPGDYILRVHQSASQALAVPTDGLLETNIVRVSINPLTAIEYESDLATDPIIYESTN